MYTAEETEKRLQLLYQITSQTSKSLDEQLDRALELTTDLLEMEAGIISAISLEDDTYTIRNISTSNFDMQPGQTLDLGNTFCNVTLESDDVVAIAHMNESEFNRHPCYQAFALESYIGYPIFVDKKVYGTLNFISSKPKKQGFTSSDHTLIKLLGEWVGAIIKRARINQDLKEKNRRLELISRNSADLICLHDLEGVYEYISPSVEKILGYDYKELLGKNHANFIHKEDLEMLQGTPYQTLKNDGEVTSVRYRIRNKSGDYIWFESSVKTVTDDDGKAIGLQSTSREVTERKRLETMFEQAQEMANVGGWEFDLETGALIWTDEVYRIHDMELGTEVNVEEGLNFFPGESKEKIQSAIAHTIETGEQYDLVLEFISAKGINKWVRAIGKAQFLDGKAFKLSGTFQDITKQIAYEKRIVAQNEELSRLTETRDKIYSIIAHDLKGAFFGITGMLDIVDEELNEPDHDIEEVIDKINLTNISAQNSYDLLENLLDWIQIQNSEMNIENEEINLSDIILKSISVFETSAANKDIKIVSDISEIVVKGNETMLATVFRNLISNAIKYSEKGNQIIVSTKETLQTVEISIQDFGVGMPDKVKDLLFDKDNRPQRRGTLYEKGTGLGLLLCDDIVKAHHGQITVFSEEGKGSEFIIELPLK